jgi:biopolymer transport protein ExbD
MTSLLDILFILIVFFLVAATFREEERDLAVALPRADESSPLTAQPRVIVVNVRRDGRYVLGDRALELPGLAERVRAALAADSERKILIRGDRDARHEHVAAAIRACREAGAVQAHVGYDCVPLP